MLKFDVWKDGKNKAVTMSYDDGVVFDKRLIEIFDKNGIKGTFHLNSGLIGTDRRLDAAEIKETYKNHEIAVHGVKHLDLCSIPEQSIISEIYEDRLALENLTDRTVVGMSYAYGTYNDAICEHLKTCGIAYSRTTQSTRRFRLPDDFLKWHPTCHHRDAAELTDIFLNNSYGHGMLLYIWGHSYEFDRDNNWELIENVCEKLANRADIWYATNLEIYDYATALKRLRISADNKRVYNPSDSDLWFSVDGQVIKICAGETIKLH